MKALVLQELSGPAGLAYTDVDDIVASESHVVIDVGAAGVCFPDLLMTRGEYQLKLPPPFVPGMETAGVVRSAPEGSGLSPGDRVCAMGIVGGYAERIAVPVQSVLQTPPELGDGEAVSLLVNYYTMYFALARRAKLESGESVLVMGSAGGIGTAAIQVAKAMGAKVIAVVHRVEALDFVRSLGADAVIPMADGWSKVVRELTDGRGVDIVVDPVGGTAFDEGIRALAAEGRLLVVGFAAGAIPTVKVNRLLLRNVGVLGVAWGEFLVRNPGAQAQCGVEVNKLVTAGLKPPPPQRYSLADGRKALEDLAIGAVRGKAVLVP